MLRSMSLCIAISGVLGAGCELTPARKPAPVAAAPTPTPTPTPTPAPTPTPQAAADASASCVNAATKIYDLQSATLTEPDRKAEFEKLRPQFVEQVGRSCTQEGWSQAVVTCIVGAADTVALGRCSEMLRAEKPAKPAQPPGTAPTPPPAAAPPAAAPPAAAPPVAAPPARPVVR